MNIEIRGSVSGLVERDPIGCFWGVPKLAFSNTQNTIFAVILFKGKGHCRTYGLNKISSLRTQRVEIDRAKVNIVDPDRNKMAGKL